MSSQRDNHNDAAYQAWEQRVGPAMRARYADFAPREPLFEVRPDDVALVKPDYVIRQPAPDLVTVSAPDGQSVTFKNLLVTDLTTALAQIDGRTPVIGLIHAASPRLPLGAWQALLQALLGTAVDVPGVFQALSAIVSRTEIVRFPEQPSRALWRNYWENAAALRKQLPDLYGRLDDPDGFRTMLSRLHALATVGESGQSFYGGYGLIPTVPGGYREIGVQTAIPGSLLCTIAHWSSLLGGWPIERDGDMTTPGGQAMNLVRDGGNVICHPATDTALFALLDEARVALRNARDAIRTDGKSEVLTHLATFHQILVNAHPFSNINHSIAMNIVNDLLRTAGFGHLPHLFLDYLAQRLPPDRFVTAFAAAVSQHALHDGDVAGCSRSLAASTTLYLRYRADRDGAELPA